jgi:hypothetical protein
MVENLGSGVISQILQWSCQIHIAQKVGPVRHVTAHQAVLLVARGAIFVEAEPRRFAPRAIVGVYQILPCGERNSII